MTGALRSRRGTAALEFALGLPAMAICAVGSFELTYYVMADLRLSLATQTMVELVASQTRIDSMSDLCAGARMVMTPLASAPLSLAVASVTNSADHGVETDWQDLTCGGAAPIAAPAAAGAVMVPNVGDSVILVEARYSYTSPLSLVLPANRSLSRSATMRPYANQTVIGPQAALAPPWRAASAAHAAIPAQGATT